MRKIALIVQRYGLEVNGGAEYHCRLVAEKLSTLFDVEVLTSCAQDHFTWANEHPEGATEINSIKVRRFVTLQERNKSKVHRLLKKLNNRTFIQQVFRFFGLLKVAERMFPSNASLIKIGDEWSKEQGPYTPGLIAHLENNHQDYEALIFFTYLYYPTFQGLRIAPQKSILIPTAHDEPAIHLPVFEAFFRVPKVILYNTLAEKKLVNRLFNTEGTYSDIVGVGIETVDTEPELNSSAILKSNAPYFIYIGRIDKGKGCDLMLDYFLKYKNEGKQPVKIVLVGKAFMDIPADPNVLHMGFVEERVKIALLRGAKALIMPSHYESLSMVTLESMLEGIPVIVNEYCEVLKDHVQNSKAGFTFADFDSFKIAADQVMNDNRQLAVLKDNARKYVLENYNWKLILDKFTKAIDYVATK